MKNFQKGQIVNFKFENATHEGIFLRTTKSKYSGLDCYEIMPTELQLIDRIKFEFGRNYLILMPDHIETIPEKLKKNNPNVTFKQNKLEVNRNAKKRYK